MERALAQWAFDPEFVRNRMCFITGPRQIGKSTLVKDYLKKYNQLSNYYNWDTPSVKKDFALNKVFFTKNLATSGINTIAFDEIHKYPKWKNLLKGYYDEYKESLRFIISGSARLDFMRKSGDSLVGRYFLFRMFPFSPNELIGNNDLKKLWNFLGAIPDIPATKPEMNQAIQSLLKFSGFPEPIIAHKESFAKRWRTEHNSLLIREDLSELTNIHQIRKLETLAYLLPTKVGSPLSLNSLRNDLDCSHATVVSWVSALKLIYYCFTIPPYSNKISQAIKKEEKCYLWDWSLIEEDGARFENFIAVMLFRHLSYLNETGVGNFSLHYLKNRQGKEVDFIICDNKKPVLAIECKLNETTPDPNLSFYRNQLKNINWIQIVQKPNYVKRTSINEYVISADRFLGFMI